jgi:hypothetical protein
MTLSVYIKSDTVQSPSPMDGRLHGVDVIIPAFNEKLVIGGVVLTAKQSGILPGRRFESVTRKEAYPHVFP